MLSSNTGSLIVEFERTSFPFVIHLQEKEKERLIAMRLSSGQRDALEKDHLYELVCIDY